MFLPLGLKAALESGNCILFLGSGIGYNTFNASGVNAPDGSALAVQMADRFAVQAGERPDLAQVAQVVELRHGRSRLISFLEGALDGFVPDEDLTWLVTQTWKAIFTTNYDNGIERCFALTPEALQTPTIMATNSDTKSWDPRFEIPIFHLHGSIFSGSNKESILLTETDYARFRGQRQMLFDYFRLSYAGTPILYVGYSHRDANWRMVTEEVRAEFLPNRPPPSYRLAPSTPDLEREILQSQSVETLDGTVADLRSACEFALSGERVEPSNLNNIARGIPTALQAKFAEYPAAVLRILNSWDFVNQADFAAAPNTTQFHRGDRANWGLIGQGVSFQRDLEEVLVDRLLDFATDPKSQSTSAIVLAPAGYGLTTLMMAVAAWYARSSLGSTLFLKPGAQLTTGDLEFASRHFAGPCVFVIDGAADFADVLPACIETLKAHEEPSFLLLSDRLNEWRQRRPSVRPVEYTLEPLSDAEIVRLLASLEAAHALGRLADVTPEIRMAAVKLNHRKELLVTMREATEGLAFDAIIENEYRGIQNDNARRLYSLVCAFTRARALVRDYLCRDALGGELTEFYELLNNDLSGIVSWETVDAARGIEALRARHQIIADIVWNRCLGRVERENLLLAGLNALNLTFNVDAKAFESFTRDDEAVESLQTFEAKSRFYESACRKDPTNAYVRQHYARMLRRERRLELALGQIGLAIQMSPRTRVLNHTRGLILLDLAMDAATNDAGRRWLAQSESAFRSSIAANKRDEYSFQSLASLYRQWSVKCKDELESISYLAKAQETVLEGLQSARNREMLYVESAAIEQILGDTQRRVETLRMAFAEAPQNAIICGLLGSVLRSQENFDGAVYVYESGMVAHPDDPFLALGHAQALFGRGDHLKQSIGVMSLARMKGARDPRFVAMFGGLLAMDGQLDDAERVWRDAENMNFASDERARIRFEPTLKRGPVYREGRVTKIGAGFAFVSSIGLPDFYCPSVRYSGMDIRTGNNIEFQPGFSARGPAVVRVARPRLQSP